MEISGYLFKNVVLIYGLGKVNNPVRYPLALPIKTLKIQTAIEKLISLKTINSKAQIVVDIALMIAECDKPLWLRYSLKCATKQPVNVAGIRPTIKPKNAKPGIANTAITIERTIFCKTAFCKTASKTPSIATINPIKPPPIAPPKNRYAAITLDFE